MREVWLFKALCLPFSQLGRLIGSWVLADLLRHTCQAYQFEGGPGAEHVRRGRGLVHQLAGAQSGFVHERSKGRLKLLQNCGGHTPGRVLGPCVTGLWKRATASNL